MSSRFKSFCRNMLPKKRDGSKRKNKLKVAESPFLLSSSLSSSPCSHHSPWSLSSSPSPSSLSDEREFSGEIEKVFRYIDEDGDGKISPVDLRRCVKAVGAQRLTPHEAEMAVESSDSDGDGLLSLADFERLMGGDGLSEEDKAAELKAAFSMYSDDKGRNCKDGVWCITPKSLKRMLSRLGESKSVQDCKAMIRVYDLNGDGVLSFEEFVVMMS